VASDKRIAKIGGQLVRAVGYREPADPSGCGDQVLREEQRRQ
jgi:hypothetical protein